MRPEPEAVARSAPPGLVFFRGALVGVFLAIAVACGLLIFRLAWRGGPADPGLSRRNPLLLLGVGLAAAAGDYVLLARRGRARRFGQTALAAASLIASFLAAEVATRLVFAWRLEANRIERLEDYSKGKIRVRSSHPLAYIIQPSRHERLVYELRPNLDMDFGHRRVRTNADGMRDSLSYPRERRPRSVRILGLGDSGMFGWNLEQDEDFLSVLEANLRKRNDSILYEVLNLAVPGYNPTLEVEALRVKGLAFRPDVVLVGWSDNDFQPSYFVLDEGVFTSADRSFLYTLAFDRPNLGMLFEPPIRDLRSFEKRPVPESFVGAGGPEAVERALEDLRRMSRVEGFRVLLFGPMRSDIIELCKRAGVDSYNTYEKIPPESVPREWAVHFMHPRKEGHRQLAEHLERAFEARGWLEPKQ